MSCDKPVADDILRRVAIGIMVQPCEKANSMKPSLNLKILILLGYVALCTMLVLLNQQGDAPGAFEYQGYQGFR